MTGQWGAEQEARKDAGVSSKGVRGELSTSVHINALHEGSLFLGHRVPGFNLGFGSPTLRMPSEWLSSLSGRSALSARNTLIQGWLYRSSSRTAETTMVKSRTLEASLM